MSHHTCNTSVELWGMEYCVELSGDVQPHEKATVTYPGCPASAALTKVVIGVGAGPDMRTVDLLPVLVKPIIDELSDILIEHYYAKCTGDRS